MLINTYHVPISSAPVGMGRFIMYKSCHPSVRNSTILLTYANKGANGNAPTNNVT